MEAKGERGRAKEMDWAKALGRVSSKNLKKKKKKDQYHCHPKSKQGRAAGEQVIRVSQ